MSRVDIPAELAALHERANAVFAEVHAANESAGQSDPELRQAVAMTSAAVAALESARKAAERATEWNAGD